MEKLILVENFNIKQTLECGQVFRFSKAEDEYAVITGEKACKLKNCQNGVVLSCDAADVDYFINYFDLQRNYSEIIERIKCKPLMAEAIAFGSGIRILNQDLFEVIISFIISQNNHIPRIKSTIEKLCQSLGKNMGGYFAFPSPQAMAKMPTQFYSDLGFGYRAQYVKTCAEFISTNTSFLTELANLSTSQAYMCLTKIKGIGEKVANCILLFGLHKTDTFPVDTWIEKVYREKFDTNQKNRKIITKNLIDTYGNDSGYAQQYLFYYRRGGQY